MLRVGESGAPVRMLRERLIRSGDYSGQVQVALTSPGPSDDFDADLEAAVRRFQARHALDVDGVVGPATLSALNVPVESRIRQVEVNLERRREFRPDPGPVTIVVNLPGFQAMVVEEGRETAVHRVIVGRRDRPTPILSGQIEHVVLSPYWNVPPGILRNDKLPEIRRDSTYLTRQGISVIDRATDRAVDPRSVAWQTITATELSARYWLRQEPGPGNALGRVKFIFPNSHDVFLHDTPDRHLFERGTRAFSSGCLRLDEPMALAERLLAAVPGWGSARIQEVAVGGVERWVALPDPVPIQTVYWTAWVGGDGTLHLADDLYGLDAGRTLALLEEGMSECAQL
jgi:L,D-transpeptidase YcbB